LLNNGQISLQRNNDEGKPGQRKEKNKDWDRARNRTRY
jgi:hypothetical protein